MDMRQRKKSYTEEEEEEEEGGCEARVQQRYNCVSVCVVFSCRVFTVSHQQLGCLAPTVLCSAVLELEGELLQDRHINFHHVRKLFYREQISPNPHERWPQEELTR